MSEQPIYSPMVRNSDPDTSIEAAESVEPTLNKLQSAVLRSFRERGAMSARQCERLPESSEYGHATVRKRVSELAASGRLQECGVERDSGKTGSTVYKIPEGQLELKL